mgnify:CR=1 FL=1
MKEFKGTPDKWLAKLEDGRNAHDIIVDREDYAWVASVHQQFHDVATVEQAEASAKLIAAAPKLLEALILARAVILSKRDMDGLSPKGSEILNKINSAINKALS